jgi:hypothetical protein
VRAATATPSCAQQARTSGLKEPQALRAALHTCMTAKTQERKAQPAPVLIDGRGISAPAD